MRTRFAVFAVALGLLGAAPAAQAGDTRIVGGTTAPAGKYPYAVHLDGTLYSCGGTLIAPEWVLTAGHCIALVAPTVGAAIPAAHITATVGRDDLRQTSTGKQSIGAVAFMHPAYVGGLIPRNDVALIRLATPITGYGTMKIAGPGEDSTWAAGTQSTIIGWGLTSDGGNGSDVLREAQVPIVSDADCTAAYMLLGVGGTTVSDYSSLNMLCAGYLGRGGVDTCQGDSGGPLLVPTTQGLRQAGVTSWGIGCADKEYPGVYARIGASVLRDWVGLLVPSAIGSGASRTSTTTSTTTTVKPARPKSASARRALRRKMARRLARERAAQRR